MMGARGLSGLMPALKSVLDMGKIPGPKGYGACSTASSRQKGMEPRRPAWPQIPPPPIPSMPKVVHLCGMGGPTTCTGRLSGMPEARPAA